MASVLQAKASTTPRCMLQMKKELRCVVGGVKQSLRPPAPPPLRHDQGSPSIPWSAVSKPLVQYNRNTGSVALTVI